MGKFRKDLECLLEKLSSSFGREVTENIKKLKDVLVDLNRKRLVKINHSAMELICAAELLRKGYGVEVEYPLERNLLCDLYGWKGDGSLIVEVETGFVPPDHALDPVTYRKARIISKIVRYSNYATKFGLASPPYYIMDIPEVFIKPPRYRDKREVEEVKALCDLYYRNPPVSVEEILNSRLHAIFIVNVDDVTAKEVDPVTYLEKASKLTF